MLECEHRQVFFSLMSCVNIGLLTFCFQQFLFLPFSILKFLREIQFVLWTDVSFNKFSLGFRGEHTSSHVRIVLHPSLTF